MIFMCMGILKQWLEDLCNIDKKVHLQQNKETKRQCVYLKSFDFEMRGGGGGGGCSFLTYKGRWALIFV